MTQAGSRVMVAVIGTLIAFLLLTVGCGASNANSGGNGQQGGNNNSGDTALTIMVEAGDFYIKPSQTVFKVGVPYHFVLNNVGKVPHEIMVMPVVSPSSGMTMTEMDEMSLGMFEEEDFPAGATGSFDLTFTKPYAAGEIEFACHIAGHYEGGMHTAITVEP